MVNKTAGIDRAITIASHSHAGQLDKQGEPYILHVVRVIAACGYDECLATVAALHDVVEDDPDVTIEDLTAEGFSADVVAAVDAITRHKGESYFDYIDRVAANPIATRVKLKDLADNLRDGAPSSLRGRYLRAQDILIEKVVIEKTGTEPK